MRLFRSHQPYLTLTSHFNAGGCVKALHYTHSALWVGHLDGFYSFNNGKYTNHYQRALLSITSSGQTLYTVRRDENDKLYYLTRLDTSWYPRLHRIWEWRGGCSNCLTAVGERLVLCHNGHLGVYSGDSGQKLFGIFHPGLRPHSPLCGVGKQGVLVGVGRRLLLFSLATQLKQVTLVYECKGDIRALCTDGTCDRIFIATSNSKPIVITSSGKKVGGEV